MKIIYMGTPDFAVPTLEAIIEAGHEVVLVVSQPDKAVGRKQEIKMTPVKECAVSHGLAVYQPKRIRDEESIEYLRQYQADAIVVVAFGQIIPKAILDMPTYCCVNVHASLLPKYRGAAPIQWAVINGDEISGVTTQRMDVGLDTGDIIMTKEVRLADDETAGSLFDRLSGVGAELLVRTLEALENGTAAYTPQDESLATHTSKITKELGNIDWSLSAHEIECLVKGLDPWPTAYTKLDGKTIKIWKARALDSEEYKASDAACGEEYKYSDVVCGTVIGYSRGVIAVKTGNGVLGLSEVQLEGKKRMSAEAFMNGYKLSVGTGFTED